MDATPDYSQCSLRELEDVAARINRTKFPDRYALVLRELERREMLGDDAATSRQKQTRRASKTKPIRLDVTCVIGGAIGFLVFSLTPYADSLNPNPDTLEGIFESMAAIFVGALLAGIVRRICISVG